MQNNNEDRIHLDARTFQNQLSSLANTLAFKVEREAVKTMRPAFAAIDVFIMLRQSLSIYELFGFVNADETRGSGSWKVTYSAAILPLIRCMIDCLYNITVILANPAKAYHFREIATSGRYWDSMPTKSDMAETTGGTSTSQGFDVGFKTG